jgi:hypothetical protein
MYTNADRSKHYLKVDEWVFDPMERMRFKIEQANREVVAGHCYLTGRFRICDRRHVVRIKPPMDTTPDTHVTLNEVINSSWVSNATTGVTYASTAPATFAYNVSTASS